MVQTFVITLSKLNIVDKFIKVSNGKIVRETGAMVIFHNNLQDYFHVEELYYKTIETDPKTV